MQEDISKLLEGQAKIAANVEDIKSRLDKQGALLLSHNEILARNTTTVEEHHRRSLYLENMQNADRERIEALENKEEGEKAVKHFVKEAVKWIGYIGIAASAISGILMGAYEIAKKLGL